MCACAGLHVQGKSKMKMLVGHMARDLNPDAHAKHWCETVA